MRMQNPPKTDQPVQEPIDMSPEAVAARLRRCGELSDLCRKLKQAGEKSLKENATDSSVPSKSPPD